MKGGVMVGYSLVSGLLMRRTLTLPLALMVSVDWVPLCFADCYVLDMRRVFPIPGLTGLPSLLIVLAIVESFNQLVGSIPHAAACVEGGWV